MNIGAIGTCKWTYDDSNDSWDTECDEKFWFTTEGPIDNGFKYCPYCGKILIELDNEQESD